MKDQLLLLRNQLKTGHRISFAEAMLLQRAIDILVNKAGNSPAQSDCCPAQNGVNPEQKSLTPAQDGNHLVIPDGYVMVPEEPTDEMLAAAKEWTGLTSTAEVVYIKMLAAAPQEAINALIPLLSRNEQEVK